MSSGRKAILRADAQPQKGYAAFRIRAPAASARGIRTSRKQPVSNKSTIATNRRHENPRLPDSQIPRAGNSRSTIPAWTVSSGCYREWENGSLYCLYRIPTKVPIPHSLIPAAAWRHPPGRELQRQTRTRLPLPEAVGRQPRPGVPSRRPRKPKPDLRTAPASVRITIFLDERSTCTCTYSSTYTCD